MVPEKVGDLGEKALLQRLRRYVSEGGSIVRAFSEDCAVTDNGSDRYLLLTVDVMVDGKHFRQEWMPPFHLGRKAVNVNLSDISAMGGSARFFLVSLGLPAETGVGFVEETYEGIESAARESGLALAGGNVSESPVFFIDITMIGDVEKNRALFRNGACEGDAIFVTGSLGASACGLKLLESGRRLDDVADSWMRDAILAHFDPPVLQKAAAWLASTGCVTSMMDLSDGLAADLPEICRESRVGAVILTDRIPVAKCVGKLMGADPLQLALTGGEDYHLLFTVAVKRREEFLQRAAENGTVFHEIGVTAPAGQGILVQDAAGGRRPLGPGFQHFLKQDEH
ncbi:MAG TPA: thiamine-phosphate kinase [Acidobacteriota bacterium]|nr:thiamine-phosphate kinase [Acidobacteriota bacterium]